MCGFGCREKMVACVHECCGCERSDIGVRHTNIGHLQLSSNTCVSSFKDCLRVLHGCLCFMPVFLQVILSIWFKLQTRLARKNTLIFSYLFFASGSLTINKEIPTTKALLHTRAETSLNFVHLPWMSWKHRLITSVP